jgi:transitional endoplasmic reticulum ATPase
VRLDKPSSADRASILRLHCRRVPLQGVDLDELAARTDGWTGADLESACKRATLVAIADYQRGQRGGSFVVTRDDFESVLGASLKSEV